MSLLWGGIIDKFYIQFELSWKVLKELLILEGVAEAKTGSPRDIIKMSYKFFDFIDENSCYQCSQIEIVLHILMTKMQQSYL